MSPDILVPRTGYLRRVFSEKILRGPRAGHPLRIRRANPEGTPGVSPWGSTETLTVGGTGVYSLPE